MNAGRTLFAQVMDFVPWTSLDRIVVKYGGDVRVRSLRCTEQFRTMAFAQMTYRESLRDIEACLRARPSKLYGMGLRGAVAKSTLADANELRDWRMWSDLAAVLIRRARKLYATQDFGIDLANTVYALDSTTIDLCLSLFPWADFRSTKAAVKMHTLLDLRGPIPSFIHVSVGKMGDARALDMIAPEAGSIYVMDRGYVDFRRLNVFHRAGAFFVTRAKRNMNYHRVYSRAVDKTTGVRADQSVALNGFYTRKDYPQHMRRISFCDPETGKRLVFLTNNFVLPAETIAALYKKRWQVELFFKWIKQNLRIKHFYGTSENAVKTQIWTAVCVYVLAAIIKRELALNVSLNTFLHPDTALSLNNLPACFTTRATMPGRGRSMSGRWRSRRRHSAPSIPQRRGASTTSQACFGPRATLPGRDRSMSGRWRSGRRRSAPSIRQPQPYETILRIYFRRQGDWRRV